MFVVHGLITATEARIFIENSPPTKRGKVVHSTDGSADTYKEVRTGTTAWLHDKDPLIERVTTRIGYMLNKDMSYSENYQVAHYGIGGHYYLHHDYFEEAVLTQRNFYVVRGWANR